MVRWVNGEPYMEFQVEISGKMVDYRSHIDCDKKTRREWARNIERY